MKDKDKKKIDQIVSKIVQENLDTIMSDRFGRYSKYIIQQRALPDVRDGLKPVQRRILYAMYNLNLHHDKPYKKSARVVGDVIGKYHPHGDSSIYEAMVRMAQDWKMGHTLLDMHGNVGSIDDDPAAAMRYTEVRLSEISQYIIGEIKKNTIKFVPNFDDSEKEPMVLPSIIPNLLINGSVGIASGFATDMPPHNLNEIIDATIAKIKNPEIQISKLLKIVKGPDFPTGGVIYGRDGIQEAFERGKGRVTLVSRYKKYEDKKNKFIEITEIPFGVVKSKLVHDIDVIVSTNEISGLLEVKDQSDRNGISILITLDKDANDEVIIKYLLSKTQMQIYYNYNNVVIHENAPKLMNLPQLLDAYLTYTKDVKRKILEFDLLKHKTRLEIVLGFIKVAEITDEVIEVIRKSENSKQGVIENLMNHFGFTLNQATAIAELRLYKLSKTDKEAFLLEKEELEKLIAHCELLLSDENEFNLMLIETLEAIKKQFGRPRKTDVIDKEYRVSFDESDLIKEENVVLGISKFGYLKRITPRMADSNSFVTYGIKEEDKIIFYKETNTVNNLLIFTNLGNYAFVPIYKIDESKWKEFGIHLSDFVELESGEELVGVIEVTDFDILNYVCLFSKNGRGKRVVLKDFEVSRINKTYVAMKLEKGDELVGAKLSNGYKDVLLITKNGMASLYTENDVQIYGTKSKGTKSCYMPPIDEITSFALVEPHEQIALIANDNQVKRIEISKLTPTSKKNLGKQIFPRLKTKDLYARDCEVVTPDTEIFVTNKDNEIHIEKLSLYPLTTVDEGFSRIKTTNAVMASLNINHISDETTKPKISYTETSEKEEEIMEKADEKVSVLEMDIDELLAKYDDLLNKGKK